ncbi:MAG: LapA family protein [Herminiimonas sp.]|nr:LapA family protein [Herminiimonas sp.]
MKWILRIVGVILFTVFFGFALTNKQDVDLRFFPGGDGQIHAPLVIMLLGFFVAGAVFGVLAMMPMVFRHRRDVSRHKKLLGTLQKEQDAQALARAPRPDGLSQL